MQRCLARLGRVLLCSVVAIPTVGGCVLEGAPPDEGAGEVASTTKAIRGGSERNGHAGLVRLSMDCTASMIAPTLILTSAHCFEDNTTSVPRLGVDYYRPGLDASTPETIYEGPVKVHQHPQWPGRSASNEWSKANHDVAIVELVGLPAWPRTDYHDYLRLYQDFGSRIPSHLDIYGQGYNTLSGHGMGTLRSLRFEVGDVNAYRIQLDITEGKSPCGGDSGGPWLVRDHELIACVHSMSEKDGRYCGQDDGLFDSPEAACTRTVWENVGSLIHGKTDTRCTGLNDGSFDYSRCFELPFIEDIPGEGQDQHMAVAMTMVVL